MFAMASNRQIIVLYEIDLMKKISIIEEILQIEYLKFSNSINIQNGDLNQRSERKECQQVVYTQHQMLWTMDYGPF